VCEGFAKTISCQGQKMINVIDGKYGRFDYTTCIHASMQTDNCESANAKSIIVNLCDGKLTCFLDPSNSLFGIDPCPGTYKYAVIKYSCEPDGKIPEIK